jgi:hypothetical protein
VAESPGHRLGQIIGDALEAALYLPLSNFCSENGFFLDRKGPRPTRPGQKVTWIDGKGNKHDLDFVIEKGGSLSTLGHPCAFVESAWRRYTKHSKNKAQEVQAAIDPLVETYSHGAAFKGVVLAGEFTKNSLKQLESNGYRVVYFDYSGVIKAFNAVGLDVSSDESSSDTDLKRKVASCEKDPAKVARAGQLLCASYRPQVDAFVAALRSQLVRDVRRVVVIPLFGSVLEFATIAQALVSLELSIAAAARPTEQRGFEVIVEYGNGDHVEGRFQGVAAVRRFLEQVA